MGVLILRMTAKIKSTMEALTDAGQQIEKVFHKGVVDGFDAKPTTQISLESSRV